MIFTNTTTTHNKLILNLRYSRAQQKITNAIKVIFGGKQHKRTLAQKSVIYQYGCNNNSKPKRKLHNVLTLIFFLSRTPSYSKLLFFIIYFLVISSLLLLLKATTVRITMAMLKIHRLLYYAPIDAQVDMVTT